jgi:hypothetical protein
MEWKHGWLFVSKSYGKNDSNEWEGEDKEVTHISFDDITFTDVLFICSKFGWNLQSYFSDSLLTLSLLPVKRMGETDDDGKKKGG